MFIFRVLMTICLSVTLSVSAAFGQEDKFKIIVVSGPLADPFFSALKQGADDAARDLGIDYHYATVQGFDNIEGEFVRLLDQVVTLAPDVMIVSNFFPNALNPILKRATSSGIPLVVMDAGYANWREVGAFAYVGYDTDELGRRAGDIMAKSGVRNGLCINYVPGSLALESACRRYISAIAEAEGAGKILTIPLQDSQNPQAVLQAIKGALHADNTIDGIWSLGIRQTTLAAQAAIESGYEEGSIKIGGTGLSTQVLEAIRDGKVLFAADLQAYTYGYYSLILAYQKHRYDLLPMEPLLFGPRFIYQKDAQTILDINARHVGVRGLN